MARERELVYAATFCDGTFHYGDQGNFINLPGELRREMVMGVLLGEAELREQLMVTSDEYRRLAAEHQSYSDQLDRLSTRHYLTEEEKLQEIMLKKKKLMLKDQMYTILQKHRREMKAGS
jgi:uncharacterized protein YdcH (DUF465 family)